MNASKKNLSVAAEILNVLSKNGCTVTDTGGILTYVRQTVERTATVQKLDYFKELENLIEQCED